MDIIAGLAAAAQALDIAKRLREFDKDFDRAEFKLQLSELYSSLSDTRIALADAKEALASKDAEIRALKENKTHRMRTVSFRGYNFGVDADGNSIGRPFCPVCEKTKGIQIQITRVTSQHDVCPSCNAPYGSSGYPWRLPPGFDTSKAI